MLSISTTYNIWQKGTYDRLSRAHFYNTNIHQVNHYLKKLAIIDIKCGDAHIFSLLERDER